MQKYGTVLVLAVVVVVIIKKELELVAWFERDQRPKDPINQSSMNKRERMGRLPGQVKPNAHVQIGPCDRNP